MAHANQGDQVVLERAQLDQSCYHIRPKMQKESDEKVIDGQVPGNYNIIRSFNYHIISEAIVRTLVLNAPSVEASRARKRAIFLKMLAYLR